MIAARTSIHHKELRALLRNRFRLSIKQGPAMPPTAGLLATLFVYLNGSGPDDLRERLKALPFRCSIRAAVRLYGTHLAARVCNGAGATNCPAPSVAAAAATLSKSRLLVRRISNASLSRSSVWRFAKTESASVSTRIALSGAVESGAHIELFELHEIALPMFVPTWNRHRRSAGLSTLFQALLA